MQVMSNNLEGAEQKSLRVLNQLCILRCREKYVENGIAVHLLVGIVAD